MPGVRHKHVDTQHEEGSNLIRVIFADGKKKKKNSTAGPTDVTREPGSFLLRHVTASTAQPVCSGRPLATQSRRLVAESAKHREADFVVKISKGHFNLSY